MKFLLLCACLALLPMGATRMDAAENVPVEQLPPRVKDAIQQAFAGAEILAVEKDNGRNDFVYYFVHLKQAGHKKKVEVNENGLISKTEAEKD